MSPTVSTIVVAELRDAPGSYVLLREDSSDNVNAYIWCGQYGWLPSSPLAQTLRREFRSMKKAERASDKYAKLPLQALPQDSQN